MNCGLYNGISEARLDGEVFLVAGNGNKPFFCTPEGVIYQIFHYRNIRHKGQKIIIAIDIEQHLTTNLCRLEEKITRDSFYSNEENYGGIT